MTRDKYLQEVQTLETFFLTYCEDMHSDTAKSECRFELFNGGVDEGELRLMLCEECSGLLSYAIERLNRCELDPKPRCRKCPSRCYDKNQWKAMARMMRYSGIKLGVLKLRKFLTFDKG